jgi:hypothetical protein
MGSVLAMGGPGARAAGDHRLSPVLPAGLIHVPEMCVTDIESPARGATCRENAEFAQGSLPIRHDVEVESESSTLSRAWNQPGGWSSVPSPRSETPSVSRDLFAFATGCPPSRTFISNGPLRRASAPAR